ncbi:hypothetical protein F7C95_19180 [Opitutia bacterium ISCC 51]|nr:hypothetical protein F7C95_19180 [Opitutae bacterium ISCC 51]
MSFHTSLYALSRSASFGIKGSLDFIHAHIDAANTIKILAGFLHFWFIDESRYRFGHSKWNKSQAKFDVLV